MKLLTASDFDALVECYEKHVAESEKAAKT
jgi:hypothetical protein